MDCVVRFWGVVAGWLLVWVYGVDCFTYLRGFGLVYGLFVYADLVNFVCGGWWYCQAWVWLLWVVCFRVVICGGLTYGFGVGGLL